MLQIGNFTNMGGIYWNMMEHWDTLGRHWDIMRYLHTNNMVHMIRHMMSQNGDGPTSYGHSEMGHMMIPAMWRSGVPPFVDTYLIPAVSSLHHWHHTSQEKGSCSFEGSSVRIPTGRQVESRVPWDRQDESILDNLAPGSKSDRLIVWKIRENENIWGKDRT